MQDYELKRVHQVSGRGTKGRSKSGREGLTPDNGKRIFRKQGRSPTSLSCVGGDGGERSNLGCPTRRDFTSGKQRAIPGLWKEEGGRLTTRLKKVGERLESN